MNKKKYLQPELKVLTIRVSDIIATSYHGPIGAPGRNGLNNTYSSGGGDSSDDEIWF